MELKDSSTDPKLLAIDISFFGEAWACQKEHLVARR